MTIYAAGLRRSEAAHLQVNDIDSARMTITVRQGKGQKDRLVMLSPVLLQTLRQYWRHNKPKRWLFPGENPDQPISDNDVFAVFQNAVRRAGITKKVSPPVNAPSARSEFHLRKRIAYFPPKAV
jgi:integrase/recombinase XerD